MKRKPTWWKLYIFAAVACVALFLFPPANHAMIIMWMFVMYGGIMVWMKANERQLVERVNYQYTIVRPAVTEFFDEDRVYLQKTASEITDDNRLDNPHEAA